MCQWRVQDVCWNEFKGGCGQEFGPKTRFQFKCPEAILTGVKCEHDPPEPSGWLCRWCSEVRKESNELRDQPYGESRKRIIIHGIPEEYEDDGRYDQEVRRRERRMETLVEERKQKQRARRATHVGLDPQVRRDREGRIRGDLAQMSRERQQARERARNEAEWQAKEAKRHREEDEEALEELRRQEAYDQMLEEDRRLAQEYVRRQQERQPERRDVRRPQEVSGHRRHRTEERRPPEEGSRRQHTTEDRRPREEGRRRRHKTEERRPREEDGRSRQKTEESRPPKEADQQRHKTRSQGHYRRKHVNQKSFLGFMFGR